MQDPSPDAWSHGVALVAVATAVAAALGLAAHAAVGLAGLQAFAVLAAQALHLVWALPAMLALGASGRPQAAIGVGAGAGVVLVASAGLFWLAVGGVSGRPFG